MPRGINLTDDLKFRVVSAYQAGIRQAEIARQFFLKRSTVCMLIKRYEQRGDVSTKKKSGRPTKVTPRLARTIKKISTENPFLSSSKIKARINEMGLPSVSSRTIRRKLVEANLFSRRPAKKPLLSKKNIRDRLKFAKEHQNWTIAQWKRVCFSDESKFNLFSSDGIRHVRRPPNTRLQPKYTKPTVKHGGGSVMVWGCFSGYGGMGPLYRIEGIMDRFVYKSILEDHMLPYVEDNMPLLHTFQHDNDPKHASQLIRRFLEDELVPVMKWPSQSPDMNPIENLWEILDTKIRVESYSNRDQLFAALQEAWTNMDLSIIERLMESMPKRCQEVIKNKGYYTKY